MLGTAVKVGSSVQVGLSQGNDMVGMSNVFAAGERAFEEESLVAVAVKSVVKLRLVLATSAGLAAKMTGKVVDMFAGQVVKLCSAGPEPKMSSLAL